MGLIDTMRRLAESVIGNGKKPAPMSMESQGCPGTRMNRGIMAEEYNRDLSTTQKRYDAYDRMRKNDGVTSALLKALLLPIISAPYAIKPGGDEDIDKAASAFLEHNYFEGTSNSWREHCREAFTFKPFGFSTFWKEHEKRDWIYTDEKGKRTTYSGMTCLKKLHFRCQRTLKNWLFETDGSFAGFHQSAKDPNGKVMEVDLKVPDVVVFSNEKEGDNFEGVSDFRPGHKHHKIKEELYEIESIGLEKNGVGLWNSQEQETSTATTDDKNKQAELMIGLYAHEDMGLMTTKAWKVENLRGDINTTAFQNTINHHMTMLALSVLADFMIIGLIGAGGSRALVQPKIDNFEKSLMESIEVFCETHNKYVAAPLIAHNFNVAKPPKLYCRGLSKDDVKLWAETIATLFNNTILPMYPELASHAAEKLDLPLPAAGDFVDLLASKQAPSPLPSLREGLRLMAEPLSMAGCGCGNQGRELTDRERQLGLDEAGLIELRAGREKAEAAFLRQVKPVWDDMKAAINKQIEKGMDSNALAVPEKLKAQYRALLKENYLNSEKSGALAVRKQLKKQPGKDVEKVLEAKAEEASQALADKDCQDLVYFARLEIARRIGRQVPK